MSGSFTLRASRLQVAVLYASIFGQGFPGSWTYERALGRCLEFMDTRTAQATVDRIPDDPRMDDGELLACLGRKR